MADGPEAILAVDLLAFERGDAPRRAAVVDGVMRSLATGFVTTTSDLPEDLLDSAYGMLAEFFAASDSDKASFVVPDSFGQVGYTPRLVETAATADRPDWKEMLNWGAAVPSSHPLRRRFPHRYQDPVLPEALVPGIGTVLATFHERLASLQTRFLRIIAAGLGAHESYFDEMVREGATLSRAIRYPAMSDAPPGGHVWAAAHGDINLITALPRATAAGLQVEVRDHPGGRWVDAVAPDRHVIVNTGLMLERITNGRLAAGWHRVVASDGGGERLSVVQFLHPTPSTILSPLPTCVDHSRPVRWPPVEAGVLLDQVLWDINLMGDR